jgi:D-amino-acid dehydrogenase
MSMAGWACDGADGMMDGALRDIAVVGGGMVGVATALECLDRGLTVALIDPGDPRGRASYGNAGVIGRGSIIPLATPGVWRKLPRYFLNRDPALRLRYGALAYLAPWGVAFLRSCNEASVRAAAAALDPLSAAAFDEHMRRARELGLAHRIQQRGWLKLYRSEVAFAGARLEVELLEQFGIDTEIMDSNAIAAAEPGLTRSFARAIRVRDTGSVDSPGEIVEAYHRAFAERGGETIRAAAQSIADDGERVSILWQGGGLTARQAVIAAGARSDRLLRPLGYRFPFVAERGYHMHYALRAGTPRLTRPIFDTGGAFSMAPMGDSVRITSGVELARPDDAPDPAQLALVLPEARGTYAFGEPIEPEPWMGSRPSTPDGLPIIGRAPRHPNIILAFGHGHIGLATGPITGRIAADIAGQRRTTVPVEPFRPERF